MHSFAAAEPSTGLRPSDAITELERARDLESGPRMISAQAFEYGAAEEKVKAATLTAALEAGLEKTLRLAFLYGARIRRIGRTGNRD